MMSEAADQATTATATATAAASEATAQSASTPAPATSAAADTSQTSPAVEEEKEEEEAPNPCTAPGSGATDSTAIAANSTKKATTSESTDTAAAADTTTTDKLTTIDTKDAIAGIGSTKATSDTTNSKTETADQKAVQSSSSSSAAAAAASPIQQLYTAAKAHGHDEIWGVQLQDPSSHVPSQIIFQKYLNANDGDVAKAKDQLLKTLTWRQEFKPLDLVAETFSKDKFGGLGYVTGYGDGSSTAKPEDREVFTWNVYGIVKDLDKTFGDLKEFLRWRVALMELGIASLHLSSATSPITETHDPYKIYQVHDYKSVAFFRQSSQIKSASTETIKVFAQNYPELLKEKFFVNVPAIMGFIYGLMKLFVAPKTIKKFHPMSNGRGLVAEFGDSKVEGLGDKLPAEYGGKGEALELVGKSVILS